jgi:hypothetical protein
LARMTGEWNDVIEGHRRCGRFGFRYLHDKESLCKTTPMDSRDEGAALSGNFVRARGR